MRLLTILSLVFCYHLSTGQLNNSVFENLTKIEAKDTSKLFLGLNSLFFFKNNEYFNTIIDGYTLFGYQFNPFLNYQPHENIRINAGWYFQKDFGNSNVTTTAPTLSFEWKKNGYSLIFGNLESSLNHRLIEPLYDFESVLNQRLETGFQMKINKEKLFADLWIDWKKMQYWNDINQEQFVVGLSLNKQVVKVGNGKLDFPLQIVIRHNGGQIGVSGHPPAQTLVNLATGFRWTQKVESKLKNIILDGYYVIDDDITKVKPAPTSGNGIYLNSSITTSFGLEAMISYWRAKDYTAFEGGKIYQSISVFDPTRIEQSPHLLILRLLYNYYFADNISLTVRAEPYFDLNRNTFQYSYALYINYRDNFFLTKRKK